MDSATSEQRKEKVELERAPFARSSKLSRSPPATRSVQAGTTTPVGSVKASPPPAPFKTKEASETPEKMEVPTGIPPRTSPLRPAFEVGVLRQQEKDAEEAEKEILTAMEELVRGMLKTLTIQRNVNVGIKDGLPKLEDNLAELAQLRRLRLKTREQEQKIVDVALSSRAEESSLPGRKRARSSPTGIVEASRKPECVGKATQTSPRVAGSTTGKSGTPRRVNLPPSNTPAPSGSSSKGVAPTTPSGKWERRLSRKERRQMRRAEAASKAPKAAAPTQAGVETGKSQAKGGARAPKRSRLRKPRTEAILIKPSGGRSFAEVLGAIRAKAKPEASETVVKSIRQTRNGEVLLELGKSKDKTAFAADIKAALEDKGTVKALDPKSSVEIRDLDGLSTEGEVIDALKAALPELAGDASSLKVWLTKPNRSQQRLAVAEMADSLANKLLNLQHLRVGWVSCRLRRRVVVQRCFKCLSFGHSSRNCKGPDRSKNCLRCGGVGHTRQTCEALSCFLCKEKGLTSKPLEHIPGSGQCSVFKTALEQAKGKSER